MKIIISYFGGLLGGIIGMFFLPLGLIVPEYLLFPLVLGIIALLTALSAGWSSTLLARGQGSSRLLPVVWVTEAVAVALAIAILGLVPFGFLPPVLITFGLSAVLMALFASVSAWRFWTEDRDLQRDLQLTLRAILLAILIFIGVLLVASLFGVLGA